jgi:type I restriction enzyme, S subunit
MTSWPSVPIKQCARVVGGATPKSAVRDFWDGDIAWVTPKDLSDLDGKFIHDTPRKITEKGLSNCSANLLPPNSVLFSSRAPIGHVAINTRSMATNQGFKSFLPGKKLDPSFLYWWLKANRSQLEQLGNGATFKEVSKAVVERIKIPLPPLDEQKRIAAILDEADELRRLRQRGIDRLNQLKQAIFYEMFGDPVGNDRGELPKVCHSLHQKMFGLLKLTYPNWSMSRLKHIKKLSRDAILVITHPQIWSADFGCFTPRC